MGYAFLIYQFCKSLLWYLFFNNRVLVICQKMYELVFHLPYKVVHDLLLSCRIFIASLVVKDLLLNLGTNEDWCPHKKVAQEAWPGGWRYRGKKEGSGQSSFVLPRSSCLCSCPIYVHRQGYTVSHSLSLIKQVNMLHN